MLDFGTKCMNLILNRKRSECDESCAVHRHTISHLFSIEIVSALPCSRRFCITAHLIGVTPKKQRNIDIDMCQRNIWLVLHRHLTICLQQIKKKHTEFQVWGYSEWEAQSERSADIESSKIWFACISAAIDGNRPKIDVRELPISNQESTVRPVIPRIIRNRFCICY